jgi:perosamine synthetase
MPDVVAAIGAGQMERIDELVDGRRVVAERYADLLTEIEGVKPMRDPPGGRHVYQLFTVTFEPRIDRDTAIAGLEKRGVSSKIYFEPAHRSTYYEETYDYPTDHLDTTNELTKRVLSLPIYPHLSDSEMGHVITSLADAMEDAS